MVSEKNIHWPSKPFILAHRGAQTRATENTLNAFSEAMRLGADGIECDVFLSQDGIPVVLHDETLERTTAGSGYVWDHSAAALEKLNVPSLEQVLEILPDGAIINIELKGCHPFPNSYWIPEIESLLKKHRKRLFVILSSFNASLLEGWGFEYPIGLLFDEGDVVQIPKSLNPNALHLPPSLLSRSPDGYKKVLWTAQDLKEAADWLSLGVDGVIAEF